MLGDTERALLERTISQRAIHASEDAARDTWSFARAERLLGREYHGRYLIELMQNATDAWRQREGAAATCELVIDIDEKPALVVANRGVPFSVHTVLNSLGQIGQSTKKPGEAIGHKGIGFKSVLEVSDSPEIYSNFSNGDPRLAVRFDPRRAQRLIRDATRDWDRWVSLEEEFVHNPLLAVPVLRFPTWVDEIPASVRDLGAEGYETVVRLPFTGALSELSDWRAAVERAVAADVSDQILMLLGVFARVRLCGSSVDVRTTSTEFLNARVARETVRIARDGQPSSTWFRYRNGRRESGDLASEIAVGIRLDVEDERTVVPAHGDPAVSSPFHLYFPTRIGSGLPLLLHGYFEVDAGRTGFYSGSAQKNRAVLDALARLVVQAVDDVSRKGAADLASLANLIADSPHPEDPDARQFVEQVLAGLDEVAWIPTAHEGSCRPSQLLLSDQKVTARLLDCFPVSYLREVTGLEVPSDVLQSGVFTLLHSRRSDAWPRFWDGMSLVLRPGRLRPWPRDLEADTRFRILMSLLEELRRRDPARADELVSGLAGDPAACLIPVPAAEGKRSFVSVPNPVASSGVRSSSVMARITAAGGDPLFPPALLGINFVADGLFTSEAELDRAKPLGLRPFTVDAVLDRLAGVPGADGKASRDERDLVRFLWQLMSRESRSEYGVEAGKMRARTFASPDWFWMRSIGEDEAARARLRRRRRLSQVRLPARDGSWQKAGSLAFGADWADWVQEWSGDDRRVAAMRRLDRLAPSGRYLLAAPEDVLAALTPTAAEEPGLGQLAFLLSLGCWEVPPLEGHETATPIADLTWPWPTVRRELVDLSEDEPWNFDAWRWKGTGHLNVTVTQDTRFLWPLNQDGMADAISDGAGLYQLFMHASALCPSCGSHDAKRVYRTQPDERKPSTMAYQLRRSQWLPASRAGRPLGLCAPEELWWDERSLDDLALRTSPLQHLPIANVHDWPEYLRHMCGLLSLEDAAPEQLLALHERLRRDVDRGAIDLSVGSSRQAFISLHRAVYERLQELPARFEVLCDYGSRLEYRSTDQCRHDDGRFVAYKNRFVGRVPFVVVARDKAAVARRLGVPAFDLAVTRRTDGQDEAADVTEDLRDELTERIPEILAVMVNYGAGTNTLDPASEAFARRAKDLDALRVFRVDNLVIELRVRDMPDVVDTIGETSRDESYLDGSVIYTDVTGEGWRTRLARRLGGHVAVLMEVPSYTDTFTLLLTAGEEDREDLLQSWGVTVAHVDSVRSQLEITSNADRERREAWEAAVRSVLGCEGPGSFSEALATKGFGAQEVAILEAGLATPLQLDRSSPLLEVLSSRGVDLQLLSEALVARGLPALRVHVARDRLRAWLDRHGDQLTAVLTGLGKADGEAKAEVAAISSPQEFAFLLHPTEEQTFGPVMTLLGSDVSAGDLARRGAETLAALIGVDVVGLDERARTLYDEDARRKRLSTLTAAWARELRMLSLLATHAHATASAIRAEASRLDLDLPVLAAPSQYIPRLPEVLPGPECDTLRIGLEKRLVDDLPGAPPDHDELVELAESCRLPTSRLPTIRAILAAPRNRRVTILAEHIRALQKSSVRPTVPNFTGATARPRPAAKSGRRPVRKTKVSPDADRRKKQLGDEAEVWALAALIRPLQEMDSVHFAEAITAMREFLTENFEGPAVEQLCGHAEAALNADNDDEALIDHLRGFMHVSEVSDAFGFDLLGWIDPGQATAVEVKNSSQTSGGTFYMSAHERARAKSLGGEYAVLVVARSASGSPIRMDVLGNPDKIDQLNWDTDTWLVQY